MKRGCEVRVHDALRKAFIKYNAYADPFTLMEIENFVTAALKDGPESSSMRTLIDNLEVILRRSEDPDAEGKARQIAEYVIQLCSSGCS
jgi:hypothetical protein